MPADSIPINFDSTLRTRIVDGVAKFHKYQAQIQESYTVPGAPGQPPISMVRLIPNPESKVAFVKRMFAEQGMAWVVAAEEADDLAAVPRRVKPAIT